MSHFHIREWTLVTLKAWVGTLICTYELRAPRESSEETVTGWPFGP
jgi:hypothetical protein